MAEEPGKVGDPGGKDAQTTLGTVEDTNEKIHFFLNTANLKKDEPLIFEIQPFDLVIDRENVKVKIATLKKDKDGQPLIAKKPWPKDFKTEWDKTWYKVNGHKIRKLKIKKNGKILKKKEILHLRDE